MNRTDLQRRFCGYKKTLRFEDAAGDAPGKIGGYASVFYDGTPETEYHEGDSFIERIMPGTFDRALAERHDVRCLFNHDGDHVLGRTAAGTCRLSIDAVGLAYEADINADDPQAVSVLAKIRRGDVDGSSFQFFVTREEIDNTGDVPIFIIRDVHLFDVAPVTWPAYQAASVEVRAGDLAARIERAERGLFKPMPRSLVIAEARSIELAALELAETANGRGGR